MVSDAAAPVMIGRRLGSYDVLALLGRGGMGEVYRARDTKLGRDVALKVLPRAFTSDPDRLMRFEREARLLAALNHPNIAAIYGLEEGPLSGPAAAGHDAGPWVRALVLELVEGQTLAERIAGAGGGRKAGAFGPPGNSGADAAAFAPHASARKQAPGLEIQDALTIARQIADALDAAHEKGIIHRDLKPANIKITPDGVVKVLDFGLARAATSDGGSATSQVPTEVAGGTREGVILGTAPYMSPEQARGQSVDKRTDIWAFGCVLYEMLTGRIAFARETVSDTIAAILHHEPPWTELSADTSPAICRVVQRCLDKDPKHRVRDIGDARFEIDEILAGRSDADSARMGDRTGAQSTWRTVAQLSLAALVAVTGTLGVLWFAHTRNVSPATAASTSAIIAGQLTNYGGTETAAAIAPDGRSFSFVSDHGGTPDIWLRQVLGGEPVRLTNDEDLELDLAFAPDGENIYFTRRDSRGEAIWQTGVLGGNPRKVIADAHGAAPSPDGRSLAYLSGQFSSGETLVVSALDGSGRRTLARNIPAFQRGRPAWSHDGRWLSYVRSGLFAPANLFVIDTMTGRERQVTQFRRPGEGIRGHVWLPDDRHLVVSYVPYSRAMAGSDLAILDVQTGSVARVTTTIAETLEMPSLSNNGSRLIATSSQPLYEVWKIPLKQNSPDANGRARVRLIDGVMAPMWAFVSRDGRTVLFNSPATGSRNLWTLTMDGSSRPRQITAVPADSIAHSSLSPDGKRVAFVSFTSGSSDIWTQDIDGSNLRQLTNDPEADAWPVWSPDGREIVFTSARGGVRETRVVRSDGGPVRKLFDGFFRGDWIHRPSGEGTLIVTSDGADRVRLLDPERRTVIWETVVPGSTFALPMFSPDGRSISVLAQEGPDHCAILVLDTATGKRRLVARLPFNVIFRASWAENGTALIVNRYDTQSHIVLFDQFWTTGPR
jgi:serine/threonine protein kinase/Tol biopolymer transport system component